MNVTKIISRIAKLALNSDITNDSELTADVLDYVNATYRDITTSLLSETNSSNQKILDYPVVNGTSTLSPIPYKLFNVVDVNTKKKLKLINIQEIEAVDPLMEAEGAPDSYYMLQDTVRTYPANDTTIRTRQASIPEDLTLSTTEDQIMIPPEYHEVLVWGALYYMAYDERDFQQALELQVTATNFTSWKDRLNTHYYYNEYKPIKSPVEDM